MKDILRKLRVENSYSQNYVAEEINVTRQTYIKYEQGELEPSVESVRKLSKLYNVDYKVLIDNLVIKHEYKMTDSLSLEIASPTVAYSSSNLQKNLSLNNFDYLFFKTEADKHNLSIIDFLKFAVTALTKNEQKKDTLDSWQPLNLGKVLFDYHDKSYQTEMMDGQYDRN